MCNLLKCHFQLQVLTLFLLAEALVKLCSDIRIIVPALAQRVHETVHQGIHIQASPIIDLAIVACDTYW